MTPIYLYIDRKNFAVMNRCNPFNLTQANGKSVDRSFKMLKKKKQQQQQQNYGHKHQNFVKRSFTLTKIMYKIHPELFLDTFKAISCHIEQNLGS